MISTRETFNMFFGRIHLYFSPIRNESLFFKGAVMLIEKGPINDHLRISEVS